MGSEMCIRDRLIYINTYYKSCYPREATLYIEVLTGKSQGVEPIIFGRFSPIKDNVRHEHQI